ncbi:hypothetical protein C5167_035838 [Papaver somniferum]|nr:hypothetical protein C5167_035838 [Papaver somniferum]
MKKYSSKSEVEIEQEEEGPQLTPNTLEEIKVAEQVESEAKKCSSSKPGIEQEEGNETQFTYDEDSEDVIRKIESFYAKKGCSSKPKMESVYYYSTSKQKEKNEEVYEVKDVRLKAVENLKIMRVLNQSQRPLVSSSTEWENKGHQLLISGRMLDKFMIKGDVAGDIIEFYILKLQKNILKEELKPDGNPKYKRVVFLSIFAYTCHSLGKKCGSAIEGFIDKID